MLSECAASLLAAHSNPDLQGRCTSVLLVREYIIQYGRLHRRNITEHRHLRAKVSSIVSKVSSIFPGLLSSPIERFCSGFVLSACDTIVLLCHTLRGAMHK
eukprot:COSAG01_NODE_4622_length_4870_cov_6.319639_3_plen_101_part_00